MTELRRPRVLVLTSSLLTDRVIRFSSLLPELCLLADVTIWARSMTNDHGRTAWSGIEPVVEAMPEIQPFRQRISYLRHMNDAAWDANLGSPSRSTMQRLVRSAEQRGVRSLAQHTGTAAGRARVHRPLERCVEQVLLRTTPSRGTSDRMRALQPDLVVVTNPFWFTFEPPIAAAARRLGIPIAAFIPSWDNVSTKNRMVLRYEGYIGWSDSILDELRTAYPHARNAYLAAVGAPQFDVFHDRRFALEPRPEFCQRHGLDPALPIITYAVGSPNFLQERHGAADFARRVCAGDLGDVQVLVRPHPIHARNELRDELAQFAPRVVVQTIADPDLAVAERTQTDGEITDWVSTFRHSAVVVNLSSTVTVDAAICDVPVVNLDFDPEPGRPNQALVKDVNHHWPHFSPVAQSGGVWLAQDMDEVARAVRTYLSDPALHRDGRRWIVQHVAGTPDGRAGARLATAIGELAARARARRAA